MPIIPKFWGKVEKGKLVLLDKERFDLWVSSLEGQVEVTVKKFTNDRTSKQNSYYWLYLELIEKETGNDQNEVHEIAKRKFLKPKFVTVFGEEVKLPASTTKINTQEFGEYIKKIEKWSGILAPPINTIDL